MKIVLSLAIAIAWAVVMLGNVLGAGRTAASMRLREGIPERDAQRRTSLLVLIWALGLTAAAIVALFFVWRGR